MGRLDPTPCPALGTTVVPILHPSYQEGWISRLGYDRKESVAAIRSAIGAENLAANAARKPFVRLSRTPERT